MRSNQAPSGDAWIVPAFDEVENGHARFSLRAEAPSDEELAFECGEEALAKGIVVGVSDRAHRRSDAGLLAAFTKRVGRVLAALLRPGTF